MTELRPGGESPPLSGPMLPPLSGTTRQLMVLLHGYGADGEDLIGLGSQWRAFFPDMAFVAPNAPNVCALNPAGREWFPLSGDRIAARVTGAETARPGLVAFIEALWAETGVPAAQTVLCGFSQGAMMALHVGTSLVDELGGIVAFSGALIPAQGFGAAGLAKPAVALIHGDLDQVVDPQLSRDAAVALADSGFDVSLYMAPGVAHGISPDGLDFATRFLVKRFGRDST